MFSRGAPPAYSLDEYTSPKWYNVKQWGKKAWLICGGILAVIIIVVVVAVVEVEKANAYPDYSTLSYSLGEKCMFYVPFYFESLLTCPRFRYGFFRPV